MILKTSNSTIYHLFNYCWQQTQSLIACLSASLLGMMFCSNAFAVFGGSIVTDNSYGYAGLMYVYASNPAINGYLTCGATLVDSPEIQNAGLSGQVVITARHCVSEFFPQGQEIGVTFINDPGMVLGNNTRFPTSFTNINSTNEYKGKVYFTPIKNTASGKNDIAVIILYNKVPASTPSVKLPTIGIVDTLPAKSVLRMTGYGTIIWGNSTSTGLTGPALSSNGYNNLFGPRQKMTITMNIITATPNEIVQQMNFAQGDETACNGDSGSGWIIDDPINPNTGIIVGTTLGGDANCRAINTTSRLDTQDFYDLLNRAISPNPL